MLDHIKKIFISFFTYFHHILTNRFYCDVIKAGRLGEYVMDCSLASVCGGCSLRHLEEEKYRQYKFDLIKKALQSVTRQDFVLNHPVFIPEGTRRRASFAFRRSKGKIIFGFNAFRSNDIVDLSFCPQLTERLNRNLDFFRNLLLEICRTPITKKEGRKVKTIYVDGGDLWLTDAENGIDAVLEFGTELNLDLRQMIFEQINVNDDVVRISHRMSADKNSETIIEKAMPYVVAGKTEVYIPAGTFLQPSKEGQRVLTDLVLRYLGSAEGKIADLFCGVGTFSYPLASGKNTKVTAVDSSLALLAGFKNSVNRQMISNIEIINRNLFKYPLDEKELAEFDVVVFDPPRAGAKEQVSVLAKMPKDKRPNTLVAVSCNPETFARDAEILQNGGYLLREVTPVDQFVFTNHCELVAKFENIL